MKTEYVNIHTHHPAPGELAPHSCGIHPWDAARGSASEQGSLQEPIRAVGEIGLDFVCGVDRAVQEAVFRAELSRAVEGGMPVILHCVRAFNEVVAILSEMQMEHVVFHGFIGSEQQAMEAVRRGYFLSFGLRAFRSPKTSRALRAIPADHLFLETDDAAVGIAEIYGEAARIRGCCVEDLQQSCKANYKHLFQ